jgi:uncharacterized metal-binding protein
MPRRISRRSSGVSDAAILASEVDLSLQVIQYRKYPQAMTIRAKQMVEKVGEVRNVVVVLDGCGVPVRDGADQSG